MQNHSRAPETYLFVEIKKKIEAQRMKQLPEGPRASLTCSPHRKGSAHESHVPVGLGESLTLCPHVQRGQRQSSFLNEQG